MYNKKVNKSNKSHLKSLKLCYTTIGGEKMTDKQEIAINTFIKTGDSFNSLLKAGYKESFAKKHCNSFFNKAEITEYIENTLEKKATGDSNVPAEIASYLTRVMRGEEDDSSITQRMKAAELLCKHYADNQEVTDKPVIIRDDL